MSLGSNLYISIGSDNGLALNRQQAIIWSSDDLVHWHIYASPCDLNELTYGYTLINPHHIFSYLQQFHDDIIKWKHFPRYWTFVQGIHPSQVNSPHKGQWPGALIFSLICALNKWLSKQLWGWWFEMPSRSLWCHCNVVTISLRKIIAYMQSSPVHLGHQCITTHITRSSNHILTINSWKKVEVPWYPSISCQPILKTWELQSGIQNHW